MIDTVISQISNGNFSVDSFFYYVALYALFYVFMVIIRFGLTLSKAHIDLKQKCLIELVMSKHILKLGIEASEDPNFANTESRVHKDLDGIGVENNIAKVN